MTIPPGTPVTGPDQTGLGIQVVAAPPPGVTGIPTDDQATVEKAWLRFMQRIGIHNVKLYKDGGAALNAVETLMRTR